MNQIFQDVQCGQEKLLANDNMNSISQLHPCAI